MVRAIGLAVAVWMAGWASAAEVPVVRLAANSGLVVEQAGSEHAWHVAHPGERIEAGRTLIVGAEPARLAWPGGQLVAAENSRLHFNAAARRIELHAGRAWVGVAAGPAWNLITTGINVQLAPHGDDPSAVELAADGDAWTLAVTSGQVVVHSHDVRHTLPADTIWTSHDAAAGRDPSELPADRQRRIAQSIAPPRTTPGVGHLVVPHPETSNPTRLAVARYHVNVILRPPVALVQVDQAFYNPYAVVREGTFLFNLPRGAAVSRFAMFVDHDTLMEGEVVERQRASSIYESIVRRQRDPAILEQLGDNLFRMRVFPIFARDTKRVLLDYTVPLEQLDGRYHFRLPLMSDAEPIWEVRIGGTLDASIAADSIACDSHPDVEFLRQPDGSTTFELRRQAYRPTDDLTIRAAGRNQPEPATRSFLAEPLQGVADGEMLLESAHQMRRYFLTTLPPAALGEVEPAAADVVVLVDTSESSRRLPELRRHVGTIVGNLRPRDRFQILTVDYGVRRLTDDWLRGGTNAANDALARLEQEFPLGATNLRAGLRAALDLWPEPPAGRRRQVIYLGDGHDMQNAWRMVDLVEELTNDFSSCGSALFGLLVAPNDRARARFESLTVGTGGLAFCIDADSAAQARWLRWLVAGRASPLRRTELAASSKNAEALLAADVWLPGEPISIAGWTEPAVERVELTLAWQQDDQAAQRVEHAVRFDAAAEDAITGRWWAQQQLALWQRKLDAGGIAGEDLQRRIIALSREWGLLNRLTAFLVLETEADYQSRNLARLPRRRYWSRDPLPAVEPLPDTWLTRYIRPRPASDDDIVSRARKLHELGASDAALTLLEANLRAHGARHDEEVEQLMAAIRPRAAWQRRLQRVGAYRNWFEPAPVAPPTHNLLWRLGVALGEPSAWSAAGGASPLLKPTTIGWGEIDLATLIELLRHETRLNVVIDHQALADNGVELSASQRLIGDGQIGLGALLHHALARLGLCLVEQPHRLWLTTADQAEETMHVRLYPVADLLGHPVPIDPRDLSLPQYDAHRLAGVQIERRLSRPQIVNLADMRLEDAIAQVCHQAGVPWMIDPRLLNDRGENWLRVPVQGAWRDVPGEESLRWVLEQAPAPLKHQICDGVVMIASAEEPPINTQLHSAIGLSIEFRVDRRQQAEGQPPAWDRRVGGGWAGGAGFSGGIGGAFFGGGVGGGGFGGGTAGGSQGGQGSNAGMSEIPGEVAQRADQAPPLPGPPAQAGDAGGAAAAPEPVVVARADPPPALLDADSRFAPAYDAEVVLDLVGNLVEPIDWDWVGGANSISFFEPTLDIVVTAPWSAQRQIADLFDRLRAVPARPPSVSHVGPATWYDPRLIGKPAFDGEHLDDLIETVTRHVSPTNWADVGGGAAIEFDSARDLLAVRAPDAMHRELHEFLTLLRRSLYRHRTGRQPWDAGPIVLDGQPAEESLAGLQPNRQFLLLAGVTDDDRALLAARQATAPGLLEYRLKLPEGNTQRLHLRSHGPRQEIVIDGLRARLEAARAAVAYEGLQLVEHGPWAEDVRRRAELALPWLPHYSNDELLERYRVEPLPPSDEAAGDAVWLRLVPRAYSDAETLHLRVAFQPNTGLPVVWQCYQQDELVWKLAFADELDTGRGWVWQRVEQVTVDGHTLARWQWTGNAAPGERAESPELPPLDQWPRYAQLWRADHAADRQLADILRSIGDGRWQRAGELVELWEGELPLLVDWLAAWCHQHEPTSVPRWRALEGLTRIAQSRALTLVRSIDRTTFSFLEGAQWYELALLQAADTRSPSDLLRLSQAAEHAGQRAAAVEWLDQAIQRLPPDEAFPNQLHRIRMLLGNDETQQALAQALELIANPAVSPLQAVDVPRLLASAGEAEAAAQGFALLLERVDLSDNLRAGALLDLASVQNGLGRWHSMTKAIELLYLHDVTDGGAAADVRVRTQFQRLAAELNDPDDIARLVPTAESPWLRQQLLCLEADRSDDAERIAALYHRLREEGLLHGRGTWAGQQLSRAGRYDLVVQHMEGRLRAGETISREDRLMLGKAYTHLQRWTDADRAFTGD